ncbi:hypothetical protein [Bacillus alkalicellulosilyticus]|uniref:hypothetical protein n=1 Tax=Alkalihalobacterium alkalicellulosilyticum TaxID=1912214 RepID=UPI000996D996|nr:hypothetical protein [Bacillus alkalicellulosilyticus]
MKIYEPELKKALLKFEKMRVSLPDEKSSVIHYKSFIRNFTKITTKHVTLPTTEIMTLLKHEKPTVFSIIRNESLNGSLYYFLTHIDFDYATAKKNFDAILEKMDKKVG